MTDSNQGTLSSPVSFTGIGVHMGLDVTMTIRPAPVSTGIVFVRTDLPDAPSVPARVEYIERSVMMSTAVRFGDALVRTTEHVLAALVGCEIDNAIIDLDAPECPIMDGSAEVFVSAIQAAGRVSQDEPAAVLEVLKPVRVGDDSRWACLEPADHFSADISTVHDHPAFASTPQAVNHDASIDSLVSDILPARTFGFLSDYERAKQAGYALGSNLDNTIVFDEDAMVNEEPLRFPDECARHKCLDAIGDLALLGYRLQARLSSHCSGHAQTAELMRALLADKTQYVVVKD